MTKNGMKINQSNSNIRCEKEEIQMSLNGKMIEQVNEFRFMRITLDDSGKQEVELNNSIEKANKAFYAMSQGFRSKKEVL